MCVAVNSLYVNVIVCFVYYAASFLRLFLIALNVMAQRRAGCVEAFERSWIFAGRFVALLAHKPPNGIKSNTFPFGGGVCAMLLPYMYVCDLDCIRFRFISFGFIPFRIDSDIELPTSCDSLCFHVAMFIFYYRGLLYFSLYVLLLKLNDSFSLFSCPTPEFMFLVKEKK